MLAVFLISMINHLAEAACGRRVYSGSRFEEVQFVMVGKAQRWMWEVSGPIALVVRKQR